MWYAIWIALAGFIGMVIGIVVTSGKVFDLQRQVDRKCSSCQTLTDALEQLAAARADCKAIEEDLRSIRRSNYQYRNMVERLRNRLGMMMGAK